VPFEQHRWNACSDECGRAYKTKLRTDVFTIALRTQGDLELSMRKIGQQISEIK
jgi:hypothetical protein